METDAGDLTGSVAGEGSDWLVGIYEGVTGREPPDSVKEVARDVEERALDRAGDDPSDEEILDAVRDELRRTVQETRGADCPGIGRGRDVLSGPVVPSLGHWSHRVASRQVLRRAARTSSRPMGLLVSILYGIGASLPLVVGAAIGAFWRPPATLVASLLAFASGSLMTGLAFELFEPAFETTGPVLTTASLLTGTLVYVGVKYLVDARGGGSGVPLLAAVVFDGLAENITLGVALVGAPASGPLAILAGIAANNLPEAVGGATSMTENGRSVAWTLGLWTVTAVGLGVTVVAGSVVFSSLGSSDLALVRATGGGAVLASLAIEIMPDAYEGGGPAVAVATATGFSVTFLLV